MRFKQSFCGLSLTAVGMTIAMVGIVLSILRLMYGIFALFNQKTFCINYPPGCDVDDPSQAKIKAIWIFAGGLISVVVHSALEIGISKRKPNFITIYLIVASIGFLMSIYSLMASSIAFTSILLTMIISSVIFIYLMMLLYSLKCEMEDEYVQAKQEDDKIEVQEEV